MAVLVSVMVDLLAARLAPASEEFIRYLEMCSLAYKLTVAKT